MKNNAIFLGHGSPMNVIYENNKLKSSLKTLMSQITKSKGIIFLSAHNIQNKTSITANNEPPIIYDFYGFPKELYQIKVNMKGNEAIAKEIAKKINIELDYKMGYDHGIWTLLKIMDFNNETPIFSISINSKLTINEHFELAKKMQALRDEGFIIISSGNIVHNLYEIDFNFNTKYFWAEEFTNTIKKLLEEKDFETLLNYKTIKNYNYSIPENSHYLPLIYTIGLTKENEKLKIIYENIENGSISMLSFKTE